ncbi:hypothetical protein [Meridianimarinicoccus sp. MJW13]|uniref:hypothetical protein n=1 Tax=Meridianimarinicoccus sp. MJW13 TaxID=2720031 RepID=UPI001865BA07|nr:hypothetical protein [Fluviibacterium sp. MJW13]
MQITAGNEHSTGRAPLGRLCRCAGALALASVLLAGLPVPGAAATLKVSLSIPQLKVTADMDGPGDNTAEAYASGSIGYGGGFRTGTYKAKENRTVSPDWSIVRAIDPRLYTQNYGYSVPISIHLRDKDIRRDDRIDINPARRVSGLVFFFDLQTQAMSISSPKTGNAGENATIYFDMFSQPLVYDFNVDSRAAPQGNGWLYTYDFQNLSSSHYDITNVVLKGLGNISLTLAPGASIQVSRWSRHEPGRALATGLYSDLDQTVRTQYVEAPVPLPASLVLLAGSLAALAFQGRVRRKVCGPA